MSKFRTGDMYVSAAFRTGGMYVSAAVNHRNEVDGDFKLWILSSAIPRYLRCDWSDMSEEDQEANNEAVMSGDARIFASYVYPKDNTTVWIITEADRSATTILFPEDY